MEDAERDDFHFLCKHCKSRQEEANRPKVAPLKLRFGSSVSPKSEKQVQCDRPVATVAPNQAQSAEPRVLDSVQIVSSRATNGSSVESRQTSSIKGEPYTAQPSTQNRIPPPNGVQSSPIGQLLHHENFTTPKSQVLSPSQSRTPHLSGASPSVYQPTLPSLSSVVNGRGPSLPERAPLNESNRHLPSLTAPLKYPISSTNPTTMNLNQQSPPIHHSHQTVSGSPVKRLSMSPLGVNGHAPESRKNHAMSSPRAFLPTAPRPPAYSPVKQDPPPSLNASSPPIPGSARQFSPVKQTPTKPLAPPMETPPVLSPITTLSPNPRSEITVPPQKNPTPERPYSNTTH